ncbi:MAG: MFS transporter, partial [Dehalococcoidia bacterium]
MKADDFGSRGKGIYPGWWVAGAGTVIMALLIGSQTGGTMGLFFVALLREFEWSRTLLSGAFTVVRIEGSFLGPIEGMLTDRLGSQRMVFIGSVIAAGGFFLLSTVSHPVHFYLSLLVISGGVGLGGFIPVVAVVNWWFTRRRNAAMGLAMAGVGMGALWSPLIAWGITTHSWRAAAVAIGVVLLVVGIPLSRVLRRPSDQDLGQDQAGQDLQRGEEGSALDSAKDSGDGPEFTLRQATHTRAFWLIPMAHATNGFTTSAVYVHGIPHLTD